MSVGSRSSEGRQEYVNYYKNAIQISKDSSEIVQIENIAKELDIFIVSGIIEKDNGTLYCSVGFFSPSEGLLYSRRKVGLAHYGPRKEEADFNDPHYRETPVNANSGRKINMGIRN